MMAGWTPQEGHRVLVRAYKDGIHLTGRFMCGDVPMGTGLTMEAFGQPAEFAREVQTLFDRAYPL